MKPVIHAKNCVRENACVGNISEVINVVQKRTTHVAKPVECCWTLDCTGARISATRTPVLPAKIVQQGGPVTEQVLGTVTVVTNHHHFFSIMVQYVKFVGDLLLTKCGVIINKTHVILVL
jgi:hypothetical protein